jgi:hypothetical protein
MKVIRGVSQVLKTGDQREPLRQPKQNTNNKLNIDKKDIIDAEFEEVKTKRDSK